MTKVIEVEDMSFGYTREMILEHVNFTVEKGDFAVVIGDNGVGKSTMVKLLLGVNRPTSGSIRISGKEVQSIKGSGIGYLPQNGGNRAAAFPATCEEIVMSSQYKNIGFARFPKKSHKEKVEEALKLVGMEDKRKALIGELSGGQQQRIMLARVLAADPEVLILDEPTVGVDAESVDRLLHILHHLNIEKQVTILMVTHDIEKVGPYANRVLCLSEGACREELLPQAQIVHAHAHEHAHGTAEHVHCANCDHGPDKQHGHDAEHCAECSHCEQYHEHDHDQTHAHKHDQPRQHRENDGKEAM
ncbi:MAG: metal ABC transporter ATP-binding protein [Clostridiales bacterium]|nr:metal ABC transporter ATP-binding protein [Clostridiales bacterium]